MRESGDDVLWVLLPSNPATKSQQQVGKASVKNKSER